MRNKSEGKPSASSSSTSLPKESVGQSLRLNESHQMALHRPFGIGEGMVESSSCSIEYHLTIQLTHETLSRKEISLLLEILNYQAVNFGINLNMSLGLYELYFRLLGNKTDALYVKEKYIRRTLSVTEIILRECKDQNFSLESGEVIQLPDSLKEILRSYLMTKRTYGSRFIHWRPERFLRVRIVPVDIQFLTRKKGSQPYSSYCKGYGESHPSAHRQKLRPSADYDGSGPDQYEAEEIYLFDRCTDPVHLLTESLLIKYRNWKEK